MSIQSLTGFKVKDCVVNDFDQQAIITDISNGEIVFEWVDAHKVEVLSEDEFDAIFKKANCDKN